MAEILDKEIEKLKSQKVSVAIGILVGSLVITILVGFFVIRPTYKDNQLRDNIINNRENVLVGYESKLGKLEGLESAKDEIKEKVSKIKIAIPDNIDKARLIYQLDQLAVNSKISLISISEESAKDENLLAGLNEAQFSISLKGSYAGLRSFIKDINSGLRLVSIDEINMSPNKEGDNVDSQIKITTYFIGVEDEE